MKISREDFLASKYLKVEFILMEKNLIHHNRFILEVILDRMTMRVKKKIGQIKRFSEEVQKKFGMKELAMGKPIRSHDQNLEVELFFKKLNSGYLYSKESNQEKPDKRRIELRNYLYNMLFCDLENLQANSDAQQDQNIKQELEESKKTTSTYLNAFQSRPKSLSDLKQPPKEHQKMQRRDAIKDVLKGIYRSSKEQDDQNTFKQLMKSIKTLQSVQLFDRWVKEEEIWCEKTYLLIQNCLVLLSKDQSLKTIIPLSLIQVTLNEQTNISLHLKYEMSEAPIELRIADICSMEKDLEQYDKYLSFYTRLKELTLNENNQLNEIKPRKKVQNVIRIRINNKKIINLNKVEMEKKQAKELIFKVHHEDHNFTFSMLIDTAIDIIFPILNNYGKLEVELIQSRELSLLPNFRENSIIFTIPVQNIYDTLYNQRPKKKNCQIRTIYMETKYSHYQISLDYYEKASMLSFCEFDVGDKYQGQQLPTQFRRDEMRIQKNRFKRIVYTIEQCVNVVSSLRNFEYPMQSYYFYIGLLSAIILYDPNYLLHYVIIMLLLILAYNHPSFQSYLREIVIITNSTEKVQNWIKSCKYKDFVPEYKIKFKKDIEKIHFLHHFQMATKKKRNIYKKYKRLQEVLLTGQLYLTQFVTISQKLKNLFGWYHHKKTKYVCIFLGLCLLLITLIPIKMLLIFGLYKTFRKGLEYRRKTKAFNKIILQQIFKVCIDENNLQQMKLYLVQKDRAIAKLSNDFSIFEKKIKQSLEDILKIEFSAEIFSHGKTMNQFIELLSNCKKRFIIPLHICVKYSFNIEWSMKMNFFRRIAMIVYGFVLGIPSDRSILGVKTAENNQKLEGSSDEDDEI